MHSRESRIHFLKPTTQQNICNSIYNNSNPYSVHGPLDGHGDLSSVPTALGFLQRKQGPIHTAVLSHASLPVCRKRSFSVSPFVRNPPSLANPPHQATHNCTKPKSSFLSLCLLQRFLGFFWVLLGLGNCHCIALIPKREMATMRCNVGATTGTAVAPAVVRHQMTERLGTSVQGLAMSKFLGLRIASKGMKSSSHGSIPTNVLKGSSRKNRNNNNKVTVRATAAVETTQKTDNAVVEKSINTIRFLAIDAVEKANSGHPGLPMGCAPMGHILYDEVIKYNPKNPYGCQPRSVRAVCWSR